MSPDSDAGSAAEMVLVGPPENPKPANEVSPDSGPVPVPGRSPTASACEPHFDFIELSARKGRNAKAIYQDLVDDHGFTGRYQSVKRFVRQLRGCPGRQACAVIVTPPGEEAQVDYGSGPMVRDPHSGRYRRTRMFVLPSATAARPCVCSLSNPARASGPNFTNKPSADSGAAPAPWSSTISARVC